MRANPFQRDQPAAEELNKWEREAERERRAFRASARRQREEFLAEHPTHPTEDVIIDDRAFLRGLDELYRTAIRREERHPLLLCAREIASALGVPPADVPIEGYYHEEDELTEYFRLVRALQRVDRSRASEVARMPAYERLLEVTSSPLFGKPAGPGLLPLATDPLYDALDSVGHWSIDTLVERAREVMIDSDQYSLVALAAQTRDPVIITALRESVVLYAMQLTLSKAPPPPPMYRYLWRVDPALAARGARFIGTFNELFEDKLPAPVAENAEEFHVGRKASRIQGRCVCLAVDPSDETRYYHWAIDKRPDGSYLVEEFWANELWTTQRYRAELIDRAVAAGRTNLEELFEWEIGLDGSRRRFR
jgi:hypothetical protein